MNGALENHRKAALREAIVIACVVAAGVLAFRFGNHFFVWLRMDKSLKAVPRVDVETLEKAELDDVQFREHKIYTFPNSQLQTITSLLSLLGVLEFRRLGGFL